MAETLAELLVKIRTDTNQLQSGLKTAEGKLDKFTQEAERNASQLRKSFVGIAVASGAFIGASVKMYADLGSAIHDMSLRTGLGTEAISELKYAAEQSGSSLGGLEISVRRMAGAITDANDGLETAQRAFDRIGISTQELIGLKPEEQFMKIATGIASLEDATLRAATAQDIFGRSGTELLPLFAEGADGIAKLRREAHDLGLVFSPEMAENADKLGDSFTKLKGAITGLRLELAERFAPAAQDMAELMLGEADLAEIVSDKWIRLRLAIVDFFDVFKEGEDIWADARKSLDYSAEAMKAVQDKWSQSTQITTEEIVQQTEAIAYSKEVIDGVIVTTNLFTEAEVEAAEAAGLLIENVPTAADKVKEFEKAMEDAQKATKKATEEIEATNKQFEEMIDRLQYTGTEADKFGVTMFDIYDAMHTLGYSVDEIRLKWDLWGDEIGSVEIALASLGLTAKEIDKILNGTNLSINKFSPGVDRETQADYEAYLRATQRSFEVTGDPMFMEARERALEAGPHLFQHGGIVTRPTLGIVGEKGPEAIIPLDQMGNMMTIIIELDGREISKAIMPYATQEIRARTGIR